MTLYIKYNIYPGTIYSPPSYDVRFSSTATSSWLPSILPSLVFSILWEYQHTNVRYEVRRYYCLQLLYSFEQVGIIMSKLKNKLILRNGKLYKINIIKRIFYMIYVI